MSSLFVFVLAALSPASALEPPLASRLSPDAALASSQVPRAFVEIVSARDAYFVHEPIRLEIRMGIERELLEADLIQLFRRELDVPIQLEAPWFERPAGAIVRKREDPPRPTFAFGEEILGVARAGEREIEGRAFAVFSIERTILATEPGELLIPPAKLRFAYATEFRDDLFEGRTPVDRHDASVTSTPLRLTIRPLPQEGRLPSFTGAVGRFTIEAETEATTLEVGESFKLRVHLRGEGNLAHLEPPRWDALEGFHLLGTIEERDLSGLHLTLDLAPTRGDLAGVPALPFTFFDPGPPARYRTVETVPIPLEIRGSQPAEAEVASIELRAVPGVDDIYELKRSAPGKRTPVSPIVAILSLISPWLLGLGFLSWHRIRERDRLDPAGARARRAARRFKKQISRPGVETGAALAEYLSAHLRCSPASVIDPELASRLEAAGVPADLAARATRLLEEVIAARFGGPPTEGARERAAALVDLLEPRLRGDSAR